MRFNLLAAVLAACLLSAPAVANAAPDSVDLRNESDLVIDGGATWEHLGSAIAPAGDVNGDGHQDLIVGARGANRDSRFVPTGSAFVIFGDGSTGRIDTGALGSHGFRIDGTQGFEVDGGVAGIGDMNGDGLDDVAIGARGWDSDRFQRNEGAAYVVFGKRTTGRIDLGALGSQGFRIEGRLGDGQIGFSVAGAGDVNGDERPDVVVGGVSNDVVGVVFGKATTGNVRLGSLAGEGFLISHHDSSMSLGWSVTGVGDMNGDGLDDVVAGAPHFCRGNPCDGDGAAFVVYGKSDSGTVDVRALGGQGFPIYGPRRFTFPQLAGYGVSGTGDMNRDGVPDLIVTTPYGDGPSLYVVFGNRSGQPVDLDLIGEAGIAVTAWGNGSVIIGRFTPTIAAGAPDMNRDGTVDLVVGSAAEDFAGRTDAGAAWAVFGTASGGRIDLLPGAPRTFEYGGVEAFQGFDMSVAAADMNGDGRADAVAGFPELFVSPHDRAGTVRVRFSRPLAPRTLTLVPGEATNRAGEEHCLVAEARDTAAEPAAGFTIRFTVSGRNQASGTAETDSGGRASFCYTGVRAGSDGIEAYSDSDASGSREDGEPRATARKTWLPGSPASLTLSPPAAANPIETEHCVTASVTDAFGNPTPGQLVRFTVAGGRAGSSASGSASTDGDGRATFCYAGPALGPSTDAIDAFADTSGDGVRQQEEPAGRASKTRTLPATTVGCNVSASGRMTTLAGSKATFSGHASASATGVSGRLDYHDHRSSPPMKVRSTSILALSCAADGGGASAFGEGSVDGAAPLLLRIDLREGPDRYRLRLSSGYDSGERPLEGGNVKIEPF